MDYVVQLVTETELHFSHHAVPQSLHLLEQLPDSRCAQNEDIAPATYLHRWSTSVSWSLHCHILWRIVYKLHIFIKLLHIYKYIYNIYNIYIQYIYIKIYIYYIYTVYIEKYIYTVYIEKIYIQYILKNIYIYIYTVNIYIYIQYIYIYSMYIYICVYIYTYMYTGFSAYVCSVRTIKAGCSCTSLLMIETCPRKDRGNVPSKLITWLMLRIFGFYFGTQRVHTEAFLR